MGRLAGVGELGGQTPVPCIASSLPADDDKIHSAIKRKRKILHTVTKAKMEELHLVMLEEAGFSPRGW